MMKVGRASAGHVVERAAVEADRPPAHRRDRRFE